MEIVEPIRDVKKIAAMKKVLLAGESGLRNHLLFTLGINTALRVSDLLKLKVSDVMDKRKVKEVTTIREQKTGKTKRFHINKTCAKAIQDYVNAVKPQPDDYLFASRQGGAITRQQAWSILNNAAKLVGITDNIGTHTLRKTFGYHALRGGYGIEKLMVAFNHSSQAVTKRYLGITQDEVDDIYINLNL